MPATAKLSKAFYDRLGDQIANELVGLLNTMDATFRSELRELNELNFARFDAKLEQRITQLGSELRVEIKAAVSDLRGEMSVMASELRSEMSDLRREMSDLRREMSDLKGEMSDLKGEMGHLEKRIEQRLGDQTRWFFLAWATLLAAIMGQYAR